MWLSFADLTAITTYDILMLSLSPFFGPAPKQRRTFVLTEFSCLIIHTDSIQIDGRHRCMVEWILWRKRLGPLEGKFWN